MTDLTPAGENSDGFERDRFGRPVLPGIDGGPARPWTRVTTLACTLTDEYNLNQWKTRMVAYGIGHRPDLYTLASSVDSTEDRAILERVAEQAQEVAQASRGANIGTARHSFSVRLDTTPNPAAHARIMQEIPESDRPYMIAYANGMRDAGLEIVPRMLERQVLCEEIGCSGKFDRGIAGYGGHPFTIGDLKTAKLDSIEYAWLEIAIQLSVYAHSTHWWDTGAKVWRPLGDINQKSAIVMHLPNDADPPRLDLYDIDIVSGWEAARLAVSVRAARSRPKRYARPLPRITKVEEVIVPCADGAGAIAGGYAAELLAAATVPALSEIWRRASARGEWTADLAAIGRRRQRELRS